MVSEEPNYGSGARAVQRTKKTQPRYIRITDFGDDGIEPGHDYVTADPIEPECILHADDLLFARSGATVGKTYIHEDTSESAIFAGYCIRFRFKHDVVLPRFVYWCTKTDFYARWVTKIQRPAGQPNINKEEFKSFEIPLPDILKVQSNIVAVMDAARMTRRAKLAEAESLLTGLDGFLLDTLGLTQPPKDNCKFFAVRVSDLGKRIDAYSNQLRFRNLFAYIHRSSYRVASFKELASRIFSGVTPLAKGDSYVLPPDGVRFIRSGEITADGAVTPNSEVHISASIHNGLMKHSQLESGDLLIAIVGATIGAAGVFNRDEPANINQAIAAVRLAGNEVSTEYACLYLRSSVGQALLDFFKRPVARANINLEEIGEIPLIIPPKPVQEAIVYESHRRLDEARRLRVEAETDWQKAKRWFEEQLLGGI
ncbi:MAG: hypothetical protein C0390_00070 [Syntrophus sp. (in: bacteria)]|nr:hypothetical protein [Syntrophus sp. (in: bacteria)]